MAAPLLEEQQYSLISDENLFLKFKSLLEKILMKSVKACEQFNLKIPYLLYVFLISTYSKKALFSCGFATCSVQLTE